jgi:hypothetical protein
MRRIYEQFDSGRVGLALLVLRVVVGLAFVLHGRPKVADVAAFAGALKLPLWLAGVAAYTELIGGSLLILGLLTPPPGASPVRPPMPCHLDLAKMRKSQIIQKATQ